MNLSHAEFLAKRRHVILQEDTDSPTVFTLAKDGFSQWLQDRFRHFEPSAVASIVWDMGLESESFRTWQRGRIRPLRDDYVPVGEWGRQGIDWLAEGMAAASSLGIESFWNHRISEVDLPHPLMTAKDLYVPHDSPRRLNPFKQEHPDWLLKTWWPQGLWNLAVPELRAHKVAILEELLTNYPLAGIQLDFARHTPCLPPGQEWEQREHATEFVRLVRRMMRTIEKNSGRPLLLLARVAENPAGGNRDGLDVETWVREGLLDVLVPGGRATAIDFQSYRAMPGAENIAIIPSLDGHHTPAGYNGLPIEYLRGVATNFFAGGADGISLFNWFIDRPIHPAKRQFLEELADWPAMRGRATFYAAERRGEYPWAGNYLYRCDDRPLPALAPTDTPLLVPVVIVRPERPARLDILATGLSAPTDLTAVTLNGVPLAPSHFDPARCDQWNTFNHKAAPCLPCISFSLDGMSLVSGENTVAISRRSETNRDIVVQGLEIHQAT